MLWWPTCWGWRTSITFSCSFRRLKIQRMQRLASLPYLSLTRTKERAFSGSYWRWSCGKNYSTPRVWPCGARYSSVWTLKFTGSCSSFISLLWQYSCSVSNSNTWLNTSTIRFPQAEKRAIRSQWSMLSTIFDTNLWLQKTLTNKLKLN